MSDQDRCIDCHMATPQRRDGQPVSSSFGWRLNKRELPDGTVALEWRCPTCWKNYKAKARRLNPSEGES